MRISTVLLLLVFCTVFKVTEGQGIGTTCHHSTEGTEFWFGFMQGRNKNNHYVQITVSSRENANFKIYVGKSTTPVYSGSVSANSAVQIPLNYLMVEPTVSEKILEMGIHVVSDTKLNIYALSHDNNSSDVAVIYPIESLGKEYYTMCYTPHVNENDPNHARNSEFVIVASEDSTVIVINPSVTTDGLHVANTPFTIILSKGELYQVQSYRNDLTGTYISSNKSIAVYSGSFSTSVPLVGPETWDHLYEQIPSINKWGREYYTVPLATRSKDYFRILASLDNTMVNIGGTMQIINKGEFYEFTLNSPTRIFSDKPILLAQFSQSQNVDHVQWGDAFMIILSPVSQAKNDVTFVAYSSTIIRSYYINIVVPVSEISNIELAGAMVPSSSFKIYGNGKYACATVPISSGPYRIRDLNQDKGFIAYVYGYGSAEAYGYGVGFNLDLVLDLSESLETRLNLSDKGDTLTICRGESVKLDAGPYFDYYNWSTGDTVQSITVTDQAMYKVTVWTVDGCILSDSIYILVSNPKTDIGNDLIGCPPFSALLNGGDGFQKYLWNTGDTTGKINVNSTGQYSVAAFNKYGCPARDTMNFSVFPIPQVDLSGNQIICGSQSGTIKVDISGTDESVWKQGSFKWETDQPELIFKNQTFTSAGFSTTKWGKYRNSYTLTTVNGCKTKDTIAVGMYHIPTAILKPLDDPNDKCKGYSREILYIGNATSKAKLFWDYGGSKMVDSIAWNNKRISVGAFNSNPYISLYVQENGCHSDTFRLAVGANPDFTMNTRKSRGCDTATIYFSGTLRVPDALRFDWEFGDGSPGSTKQNISHYYGKTGNYDVSLLITNTLTGCKIGFTIEDMVKIFKTPVAKMSTDPVICYNDTIPVFYTLNVDSSFCEWKLTGASKIGNGNDSIRIKIEKPFATIGLQVDEFGCKSQWVETTIKRKPNFDFSALPDEGCQPLKVVFKPGSSDGFLNYTWKSDTMKTTGDEATLLFTRPGKFAVTLSARSAETGCSDSLKKNNYIWVHPKPMTAFIVDYPVAILGQSNLIFTNQTTLADHFEWNFGDGFTSNEKNPRHNYTKLGKFPVELRAESEFGCKDTAGMSLEILPFDVATPNAFRPDSYIDENRVFMPFSIGVDPEKFHIMIFNRWGQVVFESKSLGNTWDGTLNNGRKAPVGNYVWIAEYTDIQGFKHERKGQVLLIR